jgi:N-acetylneuraminic acid mutarotase
MTSITWTQVASLPVARSEHMGAVVGGKLYVFGGYVDLTFKPTRRSDVYDPATNTWTRIADLPVGVTHSGTVVDGTSVYFAGGYPETATFQKYATAAVYRYDVPTDTFNAMPPLPAGRGGGALTLLGRELHYFGGSDAARADTADHWALNLDNAAAGWAVRAPLPVARNHVGGVALGGKIYAVGGQQGQNDDSVFRSELDAYDPAADAWTTLAPLPNPPRSHITNGTTVWNGQILTFGGETVGHKVITNVSAYNPVTNTWSTPAGLPAGRLSGVADLLSENRVIFAGGSSSTGIQGTVWVGQIA